MLNFIKLIYWFEMHKACFEENDIDAVIHFAGLKAVGEQLKSRWNTMKTISAERLILSRQ